MIARKNIFRMILGIKVFALSTGAQAVPFVFPVTVVPGNANFVGNGPGLPPKDSTPSAQFTVVGNFAATDVISITVSGTSDIAAGEQMVGYSANAAGVTVNAVNSIYSQFRDIGTIAVSPPFDPAPLNAPYGALLLSLNDFVSSAIVPFVADVSSGLGQSVVPTTLTYTGTVGSLFGGGISDGTVFSFRVSDINSFDSVGGFTVSGFLAEAPELDPRRGSLAFASLALLLLLAQKRRTAQAGM